MNYFCYNYTNIFHSYHELFFSGTLHYFSNVYRSRIIFSLGGELFFAVSRIIILGNSIDLYYGIIGYLTYLPLDRLIHLRILKI